MKLIKQTKSQENLELFFCYLWESGSIFIIIFQLLQMDEHEGTLGSINREGKKKTINIEDIPNKIKNKWGSENKITERADQYSHQLDTDLPENERKEEIKCSDEDPRQLKSEQQGSVIQAENLNHPSMEGQQVRPKRCPSKLNKKTKITLGVVGGVLSILVLTLTLIFTLAKFPQGPQNTTVQTIQYRKSELTTLSTVSRSSSSNDLTLLQGMSNIVSAISFNTQVSTRYVQTIDNRDYFMLVVPIFSMLASIWSDWKYVDTQYKNGLDIFNQNPRRSVEIFMNSIKNQFKGKCQLETLRQEFYGNIKYDFRSQSFSLIKFDKQPSEPKEPKNMRKQQSQKAGSQPQTSDQIKIFETITDSASKSLLKTMETNIEALKREGKILEKFLEKINKKQKIEDWRSALADGCIRLDEVTFRCSYDSIKRIISENIVEFEEDRVYTYAFSLLISFPVQL